MTVAGAEAQAARLRALDPRLAEVVLPGERPGAPRLRAAGGAVDWTVQRLAADDPARGWTPDVVARGARLVLPADRAGVAELVDRWATEVALDAPDATLSVLWPSADEVGLGLLGAAGFALSGVLAVRAGGPLPRVRAGLDTVRGRRAVAPDLDAILRLHREEVVFHADLGTGHRLVEVEQAAAAERIQAALRGEGSAVAHVVEAGDGEVVAMCESWPVDVAAYVPEGDNEWPAGVLPAGRYGYLNTVCVTAEHRGGGLGAVLVRAVLDDLADGGAGPTYLWYAADNPVSPGFWQAMGYRPFWARLHRPVG
ncbi:MAG TPA: GNAT family N-acetyltransferase [Streptosporangiales bacterium]